MLLRRSQCCPAVNSCQWLAKVHHPSYSVNLYLSHTLCITINFSLSLSQGLPHGLAGHGMQLYTQHAVNSNNSEPTAKEDSAASTPSSSLKGDSTEVRLEKSNIILLGPTGCGESSQPNETCTSCLCVLYLYNKCFGKLINAKDIQCSVQLPNQ